MRITNRRTPEEQSFRLLLRSEVTALEAGVSVFLAGNLLLGLGVWAAAGWGVLGALVGIAAIQALRLAPDRPKGTEVEVKLFGGGGDSDAASPDPGEIKTEPGPPTAVGNVLAAIAMPFVAAYVLIRIALVYVVPTVVIAVACAVGGQATFLKTAIAWLLSLGASAANEYAVVRPLARRAGVSLDVE